MCFLYQPPTHGVGAPPRNTNVDFLNSYYSRLIARVRCPLFLYCRGDLAEKGFDEGFIRDLSLRDTECAARTNKSDVGESHEAENIT